MMSQATNLCRHRLVRCKTNDGMSLSAPGIRCKDGSELWRQSVTPKEIERGHPSFNPASSTPAADDECVVAYFGSFGLIHFDHQGNEQWRREMQVAKSFAGNATSPAIVDDCVVLYRGNRVDHFLVAIDKRTGEDIWRAKMDEPWADELACTACPIRHKDQLILHAARSVQSFDLKPGERLWQTKAATTATSTPVIAGDEVIYVRTHSRLHAFLKFLDAVQVFCSPQEQLFSR